jgi:hypothetical protein
MQNLVKMPLTLTIPKILNEFESDLAFEIYTKNYVNLILTHIGLRYLLLCVNYTQLY